MPLPRFVARSNKRFANRIIGPLAAHLPAFAVVHHVGRRSGRSYSTPVNVFMRDGDYIIGLTYGRDTDWAKNVLAAGGCELTTRGKDMRLVEPTIRTDKSASWAPAPVRPLLKALKVYQYMRLREA